MEEDTIRITHYINPHMFWYKPVSAYVHNLEEKRFQLAIDEYCEENFRQSNVNEGRGDCEAFPGETVAVLDFDRNKWCRCVVDEVIEDHSGEKRYNLWAIDDGVPIQSSSCYVKPLPQKFSSEATSKVKRGAIKNVLPSECIYDHRVDKLISKITPRWDSSASNVLQEIIRNSSTIYLRNVTRHTVHNVLINFGDMEFVTRKTNVFYAALVLKDIRKASEVEPRDFITRLSEIQTMNANRCLANESSENTKTSRSKQHSDSPIKVPSRYDRNGYSKISNGTGGEANIRELELNGVLEEDFDESASMVRPNNVRERPRQVIEAIAENSHSEDELYPISSSRVKAGVNAEYERQLWQQKTRPPNHTSFAKLNISDPAEKPKLNLSSNERHASSKLDDSLEKPRSTVSFLSKLEMRKKLRAAQKTTVPEDEEDKKPTPVHSSRYDTLNIVPAGFNMGNVAFDNGKVVAGGDSSDSSERKSKKPSSPSFNLRQPTAANQHRDRHTSSDELNAINAGKQFNGHEPGNGKVYKSKNTSRFDRLIEEEACIKSRLCHQRVLVHGKRIPKPIENLENANFCPEVHHQLSTLNFRSIYRIQTYAWPHILRGNSFFCVNSAATGKTFAYLPAICSLVMKMHDEELVAKGAGPVAIIVCKSSREVQRVASYCKKMLNSSVNKAMAVVEAFGAKDIPKSCNLLLNGCAVLVVTAPGYRRVYENMPNALVRDRVQCVVIDNIDSIIERYSSELQLICKNCDKAELQMVVTATYWNPLFFGFLKKYKNTIICIGAYLEAAIYGKSNLILQLKSQDMKIQEIIKFLKEHNYQSERTLVVCSDPSEVHEIVELLKSQSITHMFCNEKTTLTTMGGFKEWDNQMPGDMHVLVIYDGILPDLEICKAQHIIHFSLPHLWTIFTRRFACSFGYYKDPLCDDTSACKSASSSLVLLDENNNEQLPKLVEFLRIHNHEVAEPIVKLANNLRIQQEEQKLSIGNPVDFCSQVLDFGKCRSANCMKRHVFTTKDLAIGGMPSSGIIKMKIYNLFSPTHYTARILEHRDYGATSWTTVNDAQDFFALDIEMQQHYSNDERHRSHGDAHYNDWCVIFDEHRYWRCRIVSIDQRKELSTNRKVKVKLLDVGRTIDCVSSELLYIPQSFCQLPAQAVDVRIVGVVPHDFETEWDKRVTVTIKEWIDKYTNNDKFHVEGKVLLSIRDTVWVDTIRLVEHLSGLNAEIHEIHVKSEIIGKNFGVTDKEPLMLLTQMVNNCEAYRKRNLPLKQELLSDDDKVDEDKDNIEPEMISDSETFFRSDKKCKEIDKPVKPNVILKPIELSGTDSDDCISVVATETDSVPENVTADNVKEEKKETIVEHNIQATKTQARTFRETYDELEEETTHEVFISQYYAPDDFYVCRVEKFSFISSMIGNLAGSEISLVPMKDVRVGDFCLVLYDNAYQRAKVTQIESRDIRVFFLDLGGYDTYGSIDFFEMPDDILTALPFCAIKSGVACLQPTGSETWSPEIGDRIYDEVLANYRTFNAKVIETVKKAHVDTLVSCRCYRLLLFDPEHELESWIFDDIVELNLARYIEEERPYAIDINFGDDDFRHFLDPNATVQNKPNHADGLEATIEEIVEPVPKVPSQTETKPQRKPSKLTLFKQRLRKKKPSNAIAYPRLKCDFRSPKTIWRQDESLIVIRIAAPENVQYNLTMLSDSLKLSYLHDEEKYLLSIVLFATVIPRYATHEVRGLSIVIRLMKLVPTMQWPSLMRHGDKVPWLQQCIEVPNSDETDGTDGMHRALPTVPNLEVSSDSLSDEPDFSDNFDRFDPIEDDYFLRDD